MLPTSAGVEPAISWSRVGRAFNWATEVGFVDEVEDPYAYQTFICNLEQRPKHGGGLARVKLVYVWRLLCLCVCALICGFCVALICSVLPGVGGRGSGEELRDCGLSWVSSLFGVYCLLLFVCFFTWFYWYRLWYVIVAILRHLLIYFAYNYLYAHAYVRLYICDVLVWFIDFRLYWTLLHVLRWNVRSDKSRCKMFSTVQNITKTCLFKYIWHFTTKNWKFSDENSDICFTLLLKT